ncbi:MULTISPECIES: SpoIIE family protein phosphatase [unclassified Prevotella]|uniref:SpoIIE family protein phosphatase n=1 Tax=unclassified Prevotella TaxID=2638335 RepID=UPI00048DBE3C|nr:MULTISPECIES: SpoIIE family protein phosphatase [unclassified Prevotella]
MVKKTLAYKLSMIIMVVLLVMWATIMTIVFVITRNSTTNEVESRYEGIMMHTNEKIRGVLSDVYVAAINNISVIENDLDNTDKLQAHLEQMIKLNKYMSSCRLIFEPDYYPQKGHYFEIYAWRDSAGTIRGKQMNEDHPDFLTHPWYKTAYEKKEGDWTPPYFDQAASQQLTTTYMTHIHDGNGRKVGMLGADVSLEWLRQRHKRIDAENHQRFEKGYKEQSYSFVIDNDGTYLIHPDENRILKKKFQDIAATSPDTIDDGIARRMMHHESGICKMMNDSIKSVLFYSFVKYADWTVVIVVPEAIINHQGNLLGTIILAVMFFGLIVIFILSRALFKNIDRLRKTTAQKAAIEQELKIASHIQQQMLPKKYPPYPERTDIDIYGEIVTAKEVGGDLFDFLLRDEKLFFCIGDVSGKGVPAALMMAETISLFRNASMLHTHPQQIVSRMNQTICENNDSFMFVTLFMGVLDLPTGQLNYTNAGHEPPIMIGQQAQFMNVDNNIPLGLRTDWNYSEQTVSMDCNTMLFLYTDGYTEAETSEHEQLGRERLREETNKCAQQHLSARDLVKHISLAEHAFVGEIPQGDDISLLAIQYKDVDTDVVLRRTLTIANDLSEVKQLTDFMNSITSDMDIDMATASHITLAVEEAVVNIIKYAYTDGEQADILLEAIADDRFLTFILRDKGIPFDATKATEYDVKQKVKQLSEGGLGIHLMCHYMDSISYERKNNENVLIMRKELKTKKVRI